MKDEQVSNKYTGVLNEPIVRPNYMHEERNQIVIDALLNKLPALYKHFNIEPGDEGLKKSPALLLIITLANKYVPGFFILDEQPKKAGRPGAFTYTKTKAEGGGKDITMEGLRLLMLVEEYQKNAGNNSDSAAIRAIIKHELEFSDFTGELGFKRLLNRYGEVKRAYEKKNTFANLFVETFDNMLRSFGITDEDRISNETRKGILEAIPSRSQSKT